MRLPVLLIIIIIQYGCHPNNRDAQQIPAMESTGDSIVPVKAESKPEEPGLKNLNLNEKEFYAQITASKELNNQEKTLLSIQQLDSLKTGTYYVIDTLSIKNNYRIILIARKYTEENMAWIAVYKDMKLFTHKQVYYDNAEGFLQVSSQIKDNRVHITTLNEMSEDAGVTKEVFKIDERLQFIKIN